MGTSKALMALVIFMGVLIVAGTTGLVAVVIHRLAHPQSHAAALGATAAPLPPMSDRPVLAREPAGTRITALVRQSDTVLSIALTGGGPDRILVWDLARGTRLSEIDLVP
ncbi:hypothetical protein [Lichenicola cladoniae]|nr:hypothetical protein [Lichenicola cladoniae]